MESRIQVYLARAREVTKKAADANVLDRSCMLYSFHPALDTSQVGQRFQSSFDVLRYLHSVRVTSIGQDLFRIWIYRDIANTSALVQTSEIKGRPVIRTASSSF